MEDFRSGFVGIFGKPNAGKSTLMNALLGEKLAIVSPKAQTTRNKILGILHENNYQIIFSDTPGILESRYKLHEKMMKEVSAVKQGTDVVLFITDPKEKPEEVMEIISNLKIKTPLILVINKSDKIKPDAAASLVQTYKSQKSIDQVVLISALQKQNLDHLLQQIIHFLPIMPPYYDEDTLTDKPMRFFVAEMIREKLFFELDEELPYHAAVIVRQYEEKNTLTKIVADIVVSRDTQKFILIGKGGSMIKKIGQLSREDIEKFIDRKVFLELHVKVRKDWRNNDLYLKEYGY
ncbi:MAG: GTPase Era [Chitinophagaceae bacterium]|jgi:GTP-binding protein Era|nr:GTPase Era [Chitinophagaceae bacterium]